MAWLGRRHFHVAMSVRSQMVLAQSQRILYDEKHVVRPERSNKTWLDSSFDTPWRFTGAPPCESGAERSVSTKFHPNVSGDAAQSLAFRYHTLNLNVATTMVLGAACRSANVLSRAPVTCDQVALISQQMMSTLLARPRCSSSASHSSALCFRCTT